MGVQAESILFDVLGSDPASPVEGQVWYNTTTKTFKSYQSGATQTSISKLNLTAVTDPTASNDSSQGYSVGSRWINTSSKEEFVACSVSIASAVWKSTTAQSPDPNGDLFLDAEPTTPDNTYSNTIVSGKITQEKWIRTGDSSNLKTIDYSHSGSKVSTEVRKVYAADGSTITLQMTVNYTYTGSLLTGQTVTRDV